MTAYLKITQTPQTLDGTIDLPASKSLSNRALILHALSDQAFALENCSTAADTQLMADLLQGQETTLDCQNAGTTLRFLTAYYAISPATKVLTGSPRMKERPIGPLVEALRSLGAQIEYLEAEGYPPIEIKGQNLQGGSISMDASVSSQFITALLLIAPFTQEGLHITFSGIPVSRPYFLMTLQMLEFFNVKVKQKSNEVAVFPKKQLTPKTLTIEPDWTSASYWMGLASLFPGSQLSFPGLTTNSLQGDRALTSLLSRFGIDFQFTKNVGLSIQSEASYPSEFEALLTDHPDLVPTLATLCTSLKIPFHFEGLSHLRHKETDRLDALERELQKARAHVSTTDTGLTSDQFEAIPQNPFHLNTYDDHRLAMSWSLLAALHPQMAIAEPNVVEKSYPKFWEQMADLGFELKEENY